MGVVAVECGPPYDNAVMHAAVEKVLSHLEGTAPPSKAKFCIETPNQSLDKVPGKGYQIDIGLDRFGEAVTPPTYQALALVDGTEPLAGSSMH